MTFKPVVRFKVVGGEAPNAAQIAPKLSPLGVNPKKAGDDIQKATKEWKGIKLMIELRVQNRDAQVTVIPTAAGHVIKAMGEPARDRKKQKIRKYSLADLTFRKARHQYDFGTDKGHRHFNQGKEQV